MSDKTVAEVTATAKTSKSEPVKATNFWEAVLKGVAPSNHLNLKNRTGYEFLQKNGFKTVFVQPNIYQERQMGSKADLLDFVVTDDVSLGGEADKVLRGNGHVPAPTYTTWAIAVKGTERELRDGKKLEVVVINV